MNIYNNINLPQASKYLASLLLEKGGKIIELKTTNAYIVTFKKKEYVFFGDFTPLIPYTYGVVFSNQMYWFEILKELKIKHAWEAKINQKKIRFMITGEGFYNAALETEVYVKGDGKSSLRKLIKVENLKRINSKNKLLMPINVISISLKLNKIPKEDEIAIIPDLFDYIDITQELDKKFVRKARKIIEFLPRLPFLAFDLFVKNPEKIDKFTLGKVSILPHPNIFLDLVNGRLKRDPGELFLKEIIE